METIELDVYEIVNLLVGKISSLDVSGRNAQGELQLADDIIVVGALIPEDILTEIFLRIQSRKTLANCGEVSQRWRKILSSRGFWIQYLNFWLIFYPIRLRYESSFNLRNFYTKKPFGRNLILNSCGESGFDGWIIRSKSQKCFAVERPPVCVTQNPEDHISIAFATSSAWSRKCYIIDLCDRGIESSFLDKFRPPIEVSEYFNCRRDCAAIYVLEVELINNDDDSYLLSNRPFNSSCTDPFEFGLLSRYNHSGYDVSTDTLITRVRVMDAGTEANWQRVDHTFTNYPAGIRYVVFQHSGKDLQFNDGYYGSKMARASVIVHLNDCSRELST